LYLVVHPPGAKVLGVSIPLSRIHAQADLFKEVSRDEPRGCAREGEVNIEALKEDCDPAEVLRKARVIEAVNKLGHGFLPPPGKAELSSVQQ